MYGDEIIKQYQLFESFDSSGIINFQKYITQYLTAEQDQALQEMMKLYNSPILKWERFKEHLRRRKGTQSLLGMVAGNAERSMYAAVENGEKVNILCALEKALEEYRSRLIRKSID